MMTGRVTVMLQPTECLDTVSQRCTKVSSGANFRYTKSNDQRLLVGFSAVSPVQCGFHIPQSHFALLSKPSMQTTTDASWMSPWQQQQRFCPHPTPPHPHPSPFSALPLGWSKTVADGNSMTEDYHHTRKTQLPERREKSVSSVQIMSWCWLVLLFSPELP